MKYINGYSDKDNIYLFHRDENGEKHTQIISDFDWYFYLEKKSYDFLNKLLTKGSPEETRKARQQFRDMYGISRTEKGEKYVKVFANFGNFHRGLKDPASVRNDEYYETPREKLDKLLIGYGHTGTLEADIDMAKRYVLDAKDIEIDDTYKVLYFDIETDDKDQGLEIGASMIVSFACYDGKNSHVFMAEPGDLWHSEKLIINQFLDLIRKYDVIVGWNSEEFDLEYIKARMKMHRISFDWREIIHVDFMKRFMHVYRYDRKITSFSLNNISNFFLKEGKVFSIHQQGQIWNLFINDRPLLEKYNLQDTVLLFRLNEKLKMLDLMIRECVWCKVFLSRFYITELLDSFILRYASSLNLHLMTKKDNGDKKTQYQGGFVLKTEAGLFTDVVVFDFKSLYPNIIRSFNISPETLYLKKSSDAEDKTIAMIKSSKNGVYFDKSRRGILPLTVEYFLEQRKDLQNLKNQLVKENKKDSVEYQKVVSDEIVVKELANSIYGTTGSIYSRYFDINIAESITLIGQHCLKFSQQFFESNGYKVVAGDTDSIFASIKPDVDIDALLDKFHIELEKHLIADYNIDKSTIQFKNEKYFKRFINLVKKNYVGRLTLLEGNPVDEVYAKGIEMIKKDSIKYSKALQKELITKILYEDNPIDYYIKYVTDLKENFKTMVVKAEDIMISHRISKELNEYKSLPPHIRLAKRVWEKGNKDFYIGMEMQYIITDSTDKTGEKTGVIMVNEFDGVNFDRLYYWKHRVYPLLKRILKAVYQCVDWDQYEDLYPLEKKKRSRKKKVVEEPIETEDELSITSTL